MPYVLRSSWKLKENVRSSGAGVTRGLQLPNKGAGKHTLDHWKNNKHFLLFIKR